MTVLIIIGIILVAFILYFVTIYNGLVRLRNNIDKAWSNIDVLLKQRYDEIPKLVAICEGYMKHERETLQKVVEARSMVEKARGSGGVAETAQADGVLTEALKSLFAVVENYPDLKANENFLGLQARVSALENSIADRREFFNASVNLFNIRIEQLPDVFVARLVNYQSRELWQIEPSHREDVKISFSSSAKQA